jgi:hypothetical protein
MIYNFLTYLHFGDSSSAGQALSFLVWLFILFLGLISFIELFYLINTCQLSDQTGMGKVLTKRYNNSHFTFIYNLATKTPLPHFSCPQWEILVEYNGKKDWFASSTNCYKQINLPNWKN